MTPKIEHGKPSKAGPIRHISEEAATARASLEASRVRAQGALPGTHRMAEIDTDALFAELTDPAPAGERRPR